MARGDIGMSLEVKEGAARGKQMIDHLSILAGNPEWRVMIQAEQTRKGGHGKGEKSKHELRRRMAFLGWGHL